MGKHIPLENIPIAPNVEDILAQIKNLYFKTTSATIERDFDRAIDLLKSIPVPDDRQRATVYMQGLAEMRREWKKKQKKKKGKKPRTT
jgi:hypothetical protein